MLVSVDFDKNLNLVKILYSGKVRVIDTVESSKKSLSLVSNKVPAKFLTVFENAQIEDPISFFNEVIPLWDRCAGSS